MFRLEDLFKVNRQTCNDLWQMTNVQDQPGALSPKLIFPEKRSQGDMTAEIRISEQESRVLFCKNLNDTNYYYSIEAPTKYSYQFSGKTPLSASSDLSLYSYEGDRFLKIANVEFKSHNPGKNGILKDVQKIVREGICGNWFHTLKNIDSATLPSLFEKLRKSF